MLGDRLHTVETAERFVSARPAGPDPVRTARRDTDDHVGDLHVPPGHTGVVEAPWDPVADLGWFGDDPNRLDGVTGLSARPATLPDGTATAGSVLHAQYLTPGTTSQFNIAATVAGLPDERILDPGVGVGDVVRGAIGGRYGA